MKELKRFIKIFIIVLASAAAASAFSGNLSIWISSRGVPFPSGLSVAVIAIAISLIVLAVEIFFTPKQSGSRTDEVSGEEPAPPMLKAGKMAHEIMTPRTDVFTIDVCDKPEEYIDELMELKYSRIPVYENDSDNIIGILNIKDFLIKAREEGFDHVELRGILRKPYFVPETKKINDLFYELQSSKEHIAVLIDEYGGFSGIVTMEDLIEEVMGEIVDEYDEEESELEKIDEGAYIVSGFMNLDDLNEALGINLTADNIETVGGFLIDILGEIPGEGEAEGRIIEYENLVFKIESVKERRIEKVKICVKPILCYDNREKQ